MQPVEKLYQWTCGHKRPQEKLLIATIERAGEVAL